MGVTSRAMAGQQEFYQLAARVAAMPGWRTA